MKQAAWKSQLSSVLNAAAPRIGKLQSDTHLLEWYKDIAAVIVDIGFRLADRLSSQNDEGRVRDRSKPKGGS